MSFKPKYVKRHRKDSVLPAENPCHYDQSNPFGTSEKLRIVHTSSADKMAETQTPHEAHLKHLSEHEGNINLAALVDLRSLVRKLKKMSSIVSDLNETLLFESMNIDDLDKILCDLMPLIPDYTCAKTLQLSCYPSRRSSMSVKCQIQGPTE